MVKLLPHAPKGAFEGELGMHGRGQPPTHDTTGEDVQDDRWNPSRGVLRDVRDPEYVRGSRWNFRCTKSSAVATLWSLFTFSRQSHDLRV